MHLQFGADLSYAGVISMIIAAGTIVSSLLSERLTRRFGTALVTACSVALTAAALFGFSFSRSLAVLCLWAIPYGLGAGAIDAALKPTPVFLPGEFHGQRSLADYSPQHCKKLNTTDCIGLKYAFVGKFVFGRAPK